MADTELRRRSALEDLPAGQVDRAGGPAGVTLRQRRDFDLLFMLAHKGRVDWLIDRLKALGYSLPVTPRRTQALGIELVWTGPQHWWVLGTPRDLARLRGEVEALAGGCSLVQGGESRTIVEVSGPDARSALAKMLTLDLHPRAFATGDVAVSVAGIIPVTLWQSDPAPVFSLAVPRSFSRSFWHWLEDSSAEFGCIADPG